MKYNMDATPLQNWPGLRNKQLSFILLRHTPIKRAEHFDLMLELHPDKPLWDFESPILPENAASKIKWKPHGFHKRKYINFEGDIGGNRGIVTRIDKGFYNVRFFSGVFILNINGNTLSGEYYLWHRKYIEHIWDRKI